MKERWTCSRWAAVLSATSHYRRASLDDELDALKVPTRMWREREGEEGDLVKDLD